MIEPAPKFCTKEQSTRAERHLSVVPTLSPEVLPRTLIGTIDSPVADWRRPLVELPTDLRDEQRIHMIGQMGLTVIKYDGEHTPVTYHAPQ